MFDYLITLMFLILSVYLYLQWFPVTFFLGMAFIIVVIVAKTLKYFGVLNLQDFSEPNK